MHLFELPLIFALVGLALYTVLAGADFGAGAWRLLAGRGSAGERIRDHAHHSMGPVWEANHVWLIFVLTVVWTAYPAAFGSIASTLSIPLFIAAVGIIFRGAAYALRAGTRSRSELRAIDTALALSSILTPFALGAAVGGIASRRVPVGNAAGHLFSSWLNPTSALIGALAVVAAAYLAAVYLAADAVRLHETELARRLRGRALGSGLAAGAICLIASILAGVCALALVWRGRFELARYSAALAVAAVIAGWALAQRPTFLPGLTIEQAAAPHDTLIALVVAVVAGAAIVFPSLALLFRLLLHGAFDRTDDRAEPTPPARALLAASAPGLLGRVAGGCLIAGIGLLTAAEAGWAHAAGVLCLAGFIVSGFIAVAPAELAAAGAEDRPARAPGSDER